MRWAGPRRAALAGSHLQPTLTTGELTWLAALPAALIGLAAIRWLGPLLGEALFASAHVRFWPQFASRIKPEPVELGRYVAALCVPLIFIALVAVGSRVRLPAPIAVRLVLIPATQATAVAFVAWCFAAQRTPPIEILGEPELVFVRYFPRPALIAAAAGTAAAVLVAHSARARSLVGRWTRETRGRAALALGAVVVLEVVWLLHAVYTERTIGASYPEVFYHVTFTADETYAVLDGSSPLVNYVAQYGSLWPYAFAAGMAMLGGSLGVWFALAVTATGIGMLAIYGVLRRISHSSLCGLLLFLPVLAASFHQIAGTSDNRFTFANYYATFPLRYAGPSILAWLTARHLGGDKPRHAWVLFAAAGIVLLNNVDAGIPAFAATTAAVVWGARDRLSRRTVARLALAVAAGLGAALALVSLLTLMRAGALPHLGLLFRFSRLFASAGFGLYPLSTIGLYLVMFLTFVAALGVATALRVQPGGDRTLSGMLAWGGVFGIGAGAYYVGRSTPDDLLAVFFPWAFVLAMLVVPALRSLRRVSWHPAPVAAVAAVFGFLLMAASLAQTPTPWGQIGRLEDSGRAVYAAPSGQRFVAQHTRPGEQVAVLLPFGHRIAANLGLDNVSPYANALSMPTVEQFEEMIRALRTAGGHKIFMRRDDTTDDMQLLLANAGFQFAAEDAGGATRLWVDAASTDR